HRPRDRAPARRRPADPLGPAARPRRAPGGPVRRRRAAAHDPARHLLARGFHTGRAAGPRAAAHAAARLDDRARDAALLIARSASRALARIEPMPDVIRVTLSTGEQRHVEPGTSSRRPGMVRELLESNSRMLRTLEG